MVVSITKTRNVGTRHYTHLLLVGLVPAFGVSNLGLEIVNVVGDIISDARQVSPLQVSVYVHLDDTILLLASRTG